MPKYTLKKKSQPDIIVSKLNHPRNVSNFLEKVKGAFDEKNTLCIEFKPNTYYPDCTVPIAGIIDYYRNNNKIIKCDYKKESYLAKTNFNQPYKVNEHMDSLAFPFSKVWLFQDFEEVSLLVDAFLKEISATTRCSKGIIEGLTWALNETMDNVLQHSLSNNGFVMGTYHKNNNVLMFNIYDNGQGIYNSLRDSEHHPRSAIDAITLSIQEGKTRDKNIGQGNGLWGLHNIIKSNKGRLCITSHGSALMIKSDGTNHSFDKLPILDSTNASTSISFSFNCSERVSIAESLGGYVPSDISFENFIDDNDCYDFVISEKATGVGTRIAGARLRNEVINIFKRVDKPKRVKLDFAGISVISSSFADEFIGKLIVEYGFYRFINLISIINMNVTIEAILNRSVYQRMNEILSKKGE